MAKKKTGDAGAEDISIRLFYSVKGSKKTRSLSLTPKEYFWRLTKREVKGHYVDCVEKEWDTRDYVKDCAKSDVVFCVTVVKNFFAKECRFIFEFYFGGNQQLAFRQNLPIDAEVPDFCAVYSRDGDETYDIVRIDGGSSVVLTDKDKKIAFYRVLATNDDKKIVETCREVKLKKFL